MLIFPKKVLGVTMVCISVIGFLVSIYFLVQIWQNRQPATDIVQSGLDKSAEILQTTDEGLGVIDQVIVSVYTSTAYLDDTTNALAQTMQSTSRFIGSAGTFVGEDLINTITNTQTALNSAQASAVVIDNILSTLSNIPLIGIKYNPTTPLNKALGEVSSSLDPVQESLKNFQINLDTTQKNMQLFNTQISALDEKITAINNNLQQEQTTISSYHTQVKSLISIVDEAKTTLPNKITTIARMLTIIILWLVIVQIGILLQGIAFLTTNPLPQELPINHPMDPPISDK